MRPNCTTTPAMQKQSYHITSFCRQPLGKALDQAGKSIKWYGDGHRGEVEELTLPADCGPRGWVRAADYWISMGSLTSTVFGGKHMVLLHPW